MSFPQISDDLGAVFAHFGVPAQPAMVVVDAKGGAKLMLGAVDDGNLQRELARAATG